MNLYLFYFVEYIPHPSCSQVKVAKPVLSSATDAPMESAVVKSKSQTLHSFFSKSKAKKRTADVAKVTNEEKVR